MKKEYDFSKAKPNPYISRMKKQVTIRLESDVINYFKNLAKELGIPYQNLINLYLRECANAARKPSMKWG